MTNTESELKVAPSCPSCGYGNTWCKTKLNRTFEFEDANCWCKNCRTEFYAPPFWFNKDNWEEQVEIYK